MDWLISIRDGMSTVPKKCSSIFITVTHSMDELHEKRLRIGIHVDGFQLKFNGLPCQFNLHSNK